MSRELVFCSLSVLLKGRVVLAAIAVILAVALVVIDQLTKLYAINVIKPQGTITVIDNFYYFTYVENRGAAFGIFQNQQYAFIAVTLIIFAIFAYVLWKYKIEGKLFLAAVVLIFGGGVGNLIDRIFRGYVVDFLQFSFFSPVCNLADYFITVGAVLMIISVLFCNKNIAKKEGKAVSDKSAKAE